jgi:hypothetical protein
MGSLMVKVMRGITSEEEKIDFSTLDCDQFLQQKV